MSDFSDLIARRLLAAGWPVDAMEALLTKLRNQLVEVERVARDPQSTKPQLTEALCSLCVTADQMVMQLNLPVEATR